MYCANCGKVIPDNAKFCTGCGAEIDTATTEDSEEPVVVHAPLTVDLFGASSAEPVSGSSSLPRNPSLTDRKPTAAKQTDLKKYAIPAVLAIAAIAIGFFAASTIFSGSAPSGTTSESSSSTSAASTSAESSSSVTQYVEGLGVKANVNDYTWKELSDISNLIAQSSDETAAIDLAKQFNLVSQEGKLDGQQTKTIKLSDGTEAQAMIIGFAHDTRPDGTKSGITFLFKNAIAERPMNGNHSNGGGWKASSLRTWLNDEFFNTKLPSDLTDHILEVNKATNNVGKTDDSSNATSNTKDKIWLPSLAEIFGPIHWYSFKDGDKSYGEDEYNTIINHEGIQYRIYRDAGINTDTNVNDVLTCTFLPESSNRGFTQDAVCSWWVRSPDPYSHTRFYYIAGGGGPAAADWPRHVLPVAPGFCI